MSTSQSSSPRPPQPWELTHEALLAYRIPSALGDRSSDPGQVAKLRAEMGTLADYDARTMREWMGVHGHPAFSSAHLALDAMAGRPLPIYRATDGADESVIWPGAYVTLSRAYAAQHLRSHLRGATAPCILEAQAPASDLIAVSHQEFHFAPADVRAWHADVVTRAQAEGHAVPVAVLEDLGLSPARASRPLAPIVRRPRAPRAR